MSGDRTVLEAAADKLRIECAMSGPREVLTVYPIGLGGVVFRYGEESSVIVDGESLVRIREILDAQIASGEFRAARPCSEG